MSKNLSFIQPLLKPWQTLTALMVVGVIVLGSGADKSIHKNLFSIQPAYSQRVTPSDVWQLVYQQLPDLPRENNYISKENGKVAENNTLVSRLITYHIYTKGRAPIYRLDWKLTLADYLGANEIMYDSTYPGHETLRENPIEGDRKAITRLTRSQRNALVQVLVNIFNPTQNTPPPSPNATPSPNTSTTPQPPPRGGAELLK
ncbi:hypothetical protein NIES4072_42190 [Nostoc commune NIES-4072]|uniref:Uncharacterized protein n=1 Tax=Nostoc commune NIES-4072 TaxID=2005467 RepID=A0A2R5FR76_NOSCO|nr:hypothetical protein [Nostoc commune]BBD68469.1 hypothetical protein NIES4070_48660 [Nostoc commune HK-02]GBG20539.1 hypothetical protein NIES4072_42190 [Nostoc commune NIES-4072]